MKAGYVDTSCYVAIAFQESNADIVRKRLLSFDELISSNLLEAELRSSFVREGIPFDSRLLLGLSWILPDRTLGAEFAQALEAGYTRGADLWHLAAALYVSENPRDLWFLTLDHRQRETARLLGFRIEDFSSPSGL